MLVDDKLAKEKLALVCEELARMMELGAGPSDEPGIRLRQAARLIRNTGLTDCQPQQPMENMSVTQAKVPPSIDSSGTSKWNYTGPPPADNKDCRKFVTLHEGGMRWVGIRAWNHQGRYWMNNSDMERAKVHAWMELPDIARNFWDRGQLVDIDSHWPKPATGTDSTRSGDRIKPDGVPAPDQGSVRNATDELDK